MNDRTPHRDDGTILITMVAATTVVEREMDVAPENVKKKTQFDYNVIIYFVTYALPHAAHIHIRKFVVRVHNNISIYNLIIRVERYCKKSQVHCLVVPRRVVPFYPSFGIFHFITSYNLTHHNRYSALAFVQK